MYGVYLNGQKISTVWVHFHVMHFHQSTHRKYSSLWGSDTVEASLIAPNSAKIQMSDNRSCHASDAIPRLFRVTYSLTCYLVPRIFNNSVSSSGVIYVWMTTGKAESSSVMVNTKESYWRTLLGITARNQIWNRIFQAFLSPSGEYHNHLLPHPYSPLMIICPPHSKVKLKLSLCFN
jgi:hypothetical protein